MEAYQKFGESAETEVVLLSEQDKSQDISLTSANVFGRILKPDGKPASYVWFWIFEDTDGDGSFDWNNGSGKEYSGGNRFKWLF